MPLSKTYVHVLSTDADELIDFIEDAESSFLELGLAPDVSRPTELRFSDADDWARTRPATTSGDGWLPYLTHDLLDAVGATAPAMLQYAGIAGSAVVGRVLRETTDAHTGIVLQSHTYTQAPAEYTVYRYETTADEYTRAAHGTYG
ncbi:hypothetical protein [Haloplanus sp.]|uniref:hypothetical protein n=1 Tax=Haloplanus sp. TaxID=1961696 RepID=UPI002604700F|nr:hypothetical protein [Haloplanus sp.]